MEFERLRRLGREGIIKVAIQEMGRSGTVDISTFDIATYTDVRVLASDRNVRVVFEILPMLVPLDTMYCYGATLDLTQDMASYNIIQHPEGVGGFDNVPFFSWTKGTRAAMSFILKAISKRYEDPLLDLHAYEHADHYEIFNFSEHTDGGYKVSKGKGAIYDEWHKHRKPEPPMDDEVYTEVDG